MKSVRNSSKSVDDHLRMNVGKLPKLHAWPTPSYLSIVTGSASVSGTPYGKSGMDMCAPVHPVVTPLLASLRRRAAPYASVRCLLFSYVAAPGQV